MESMSSVEDSHAVVVYRGRTRAEEEELALDVYVASL